VKALPCGTSGCQGPSTVSLPGVAALPARLVKPQLKAGPPPGRPYLLGRAPSKFPFAVYCAACHRTTRLTAVDWNRLPELSVGQLEAMGELEPLLKDLRGDGLDEREARDLFDRGWSPASLYYEFGARLPKEEGGAQVGPPVDRAEAEAIFEAQVRAVAEAGQGGAPS
jgi:hypothetical protein